MSETGGEKDVAPPSWLSVALTVSAFLVFVGLILFAVAALWYEDDGCTKPMWQCQTAAVSLSGLILVIPLAVISVVASGALAIARIFRN